MYCKEKMKSNLGLVLFQLSKFCVERKLSILLPFNKMLYFNYCSMLS